MVCNCFVLIFDLNLFQEKKQYVDKAAELKAEYGKALESESVENEDVGSQSFLNILIY